MDQRRFLAIAGATVSGLFLPRTGLLEAPRAMVLRLGSCSSCQQPAAGVRALAGVVGRQARICDGCLLLCLDIVSEERIREGKPPRPRAPRALPPLPELPYREAMRRGLAALGLERGDIEAFLDRRELECGLLPRGLACSLCGAPQRTADKIIAGPSAYVCDVCLDDGITRLALAGLQPSS